VALSTGQKPHLLPGPLGLEGSEELLVFSGILACRHFHSITQCRPQGRADAWQAHRTEAPKPRDGPHAECLLRFEGNQDGCLTNPPWPNMVSCLYL
jgi:hypothetical protein